MGPTLGEMEDEFLELMKTKNVAAGGVPSVEANPAATPKKRKGRAAGNSSYYRIAVTTLEDGTGAFSGLKYQVLDWDDPYEGPELKYVSVSTIAKLTSDSGPLIGWAWNVITEGVEYLVSKALVDLKGRDQDGIKAALKEFGFTPWKKKKSAADRGTGTHTVLEKLAKGELDLAEAHSFVESEVPPVERGYSRGVLKFWEEQEPEPTLVEEKLLSVRHRVAGTGDLGAVREMHADRPEGPYSRVFTDLKTSKAIYPEHITQVNGYLMCSAEMHEMGVPDRQFDLGSVLRVTPDGDYEEKFFEPNWDLFEQLTGVWWAKAALEARAKEGK